MFCHGRSIYKTPSPTLSILIPYPLPKIFPIFFVDRNYFLSHPTSPNKTSSPSSTFFQPHPTTSKCIPQPSSPSSPPLSPQWPSSLYQSPCQSTNPTTQGISLPTHQEQAQDTSPLPPLASSQPPLATTTRAMVATFIRPMS